ncbi:MAG: hypothetical protein R3F17_15465 [Planctomycetota bacterium]
MTFINVQPGDTWKVSNPIEITFNADVDFASISYDSLSVYDTQACKPPEPGAPGSCPMARS